MTRRKEKMATFFNAIKKTAKNNKLVQIIQNLRGISTHSHQTNDDEERSKIRDFTKQQTTERYVAEANDGAVNMIGTPSRSDNDNTLKVPKRIKHLVNIARGIIQPKKQIAAANSEHNNNLTQAGMGKSAADKLSR